MLVNKDSINLWESFNEPTDTLLPTQTLLPGRKLVACYSKTNYSSGKFHLMLQTKGVVAFYTIKFPLDTNNYVYWKSNRTDDDSGFRVSYNRSGSVYLETGNGTIIDMPLLPSNASSRQEVLYQRAVFEHDGVFRHYVYLKKNSNQSSCLQTSAGEFWRKMDLVPAG